MNNSRFSRYAVYKTVIEQVMRGEEQLPGLPSLTLKIRQAIHSDTTTTDQIAELLEQDPALCAKLLKYAASPIYKTAVTPNSVEAVLSLLGRQAVANIVMIHSVSSLFIMTNRELNKLFKLAWKRLILNAACSSVLAEAVGFRPADQLVISSILSNLGTLALLTALKDAPEIPDETTYLDLCNEYNLSLSTILLRKWAMDEAFINDLRGIGQWQSSEAGPKLTLIDVMNLGQYHTLGLLDSSSQLPPITEVAAFKKLPAGLNMVTEEGQLALLLDKQEKISAIVNLMSN